MREEQETAVPTRIAGKRTALTVDKRLIILGVCLLLLGCVAGYRYHAYLFPPEGAGEEALTVLAAAEPPPAAEIAVHVKGAVKESGVYRFDAGARVEEAVLAAAALPEADLDRLNLAAFLIDGSQVIVPYLAVAGADAAALSEAERVNAMFEAAGGADGSGSGLVAAPTGGNPGAAQGKININTASAATLQRLSGIGEVKAAAIVAYREANGAFTSIEQIKRVSGIGDGIFSQIQDDICVE